MHDYGKKETEAANYATKQQQHKLIPLLFFYITQDSRAIRIESFY